MRSSCCRRTHRNGRAALIADRSVAGAAEAFWNKVEAFEKREDAQFAKEFIIALPVELIERAEHRADAPVRDRAGAGARDRWPTGSITTNQATRTCI
jgi:ATP-dependent exoDNAse (exonuclease V) alpha subunit